MFCAQVLGVYEWAGFNPVPPEFWLFPEVFPFHPGTETSTSLETRDN